MSRAKTNVPKRATTKGGGRTGGFKKANDLPDDLADAAEAALDDLLGGGPTMDRSASIPIELDDMYEAGTVTSANAIVEPPPPIAPAPVAKRVPPPPGKKRPKTMPPPVEADILDERGFAPRGNNSVGIVDVIEEQELPQIPQLDIAVYEQADHLASAQGAIVANGHRVLVGASGTSGLTKVADQVVSGLDVVLVSLPGGEPVIDIALAQDPRRPIVIASVSGKKGEAVRKAIAAGADLVTMRPHDPDRIAPALLAAARLSVERKISQNARGSEAVLRAKLEELQDPDIRGLQPFETFRRVLELEVKRAKRFEYPLSVALFAVEVPPPPPPAGIRGILRARAGNALIHTIRDIDLATQLDHERFLVLLPYTDLKGATGLGRRVIAAVAQGDPVVSAGRSFPPRVVGAVAGGRPGEELSFARLMKDATQALNQARRDGAELAVQP